MKKSILFSISIFLLSWILPQIVLAKLDLKDGETFVFLGDSITHRGPYSQYIETFYVTRYPERRIRFINSGISGDKAADALARFEEDVAFFNPQYVSVMLGMNDGGYKDFSQEIFSTYREDMEEVLNRILAIGAEPLLISPTIFDQQQYTLQCRNPEFRFIRLQASDHYNGTLALFGAWGRESAMARKWNYVNFWGPLNDLTTDQRQTDPLFTFVEDAIHPGPVGHAIMAHAFIGEVSPDRRIVSSVSANLKNGKWTIRAGNAEVSEVDGAADHLSFTLRANSLPWVLPEEAAAGYKLAKSGHQKSNESLAISDLAPGFYEITIDGKSIGNKFSHIQLGRKIELQSNTATPQYQQATHVAALIKERFENTLVPYRDQQVKMKGKRREYGNDAEEVKAFRKTLQPELNSLLEQAEEFIHKIHEAAQPKERRYTIRRVSA